MAKIFEIQNPAEHQQDFLTLVILALHPANMNCLPPEGWNRMTPN
jgi:hypothetical protein